MSICTCFVGVILDFFLVSSSLSLLSVSSLSELASPSTIAFCSASLIKYCLFYSVYSSSLRTAAYMSMAKAMIMLRPIMTPK